jgi:hypothetical protein
MKADVQGVTPEPEESLSMTMAAHG